MKPCIVIYDKHFNIYEAYHENARLVVRRNDWSELLRGLDLYNYEIVPNNTRFAKTILDKLNQHHI